MNHTLRSFKQAAHELIDKLPNEASWLDLIEHATERQDMIEAADLGDYDSGTLELTLQEYDLFRVEQSREQGEERVPY
jgi:hypothetical protein